MQRLALEAIIAGRDGPVRVITTHLEYFSPRQRMAQVDGLLQIHAEACGHALALRPQTHSGEAFDAVLRPASAVLCGDFNFRPEHPEHVRITAESAPGAGRWVDGWAYSRREPHAATVGLHEDLGGPFCCDFVFVTEDLAPRIRAMRVDQSTRASVHQPVIMELDL